MKRGAMLIGILVGVISLLYVGLYGGLFGSFMIWADPSGQSGINGRVIQIVSILLPTLTIIGGGICGAKPKIGGAVLMVAAVGHGCLLGTNTLGLIFTFPIAAGGVLGLISEERDSSGIELGIVYVGLMIGGDYIAYLIGSVIERAAPTASLTAFLAMYFLFLWVAWVLAVKLTEPVAVPVPAQP